MNTRKKILGTYSMKIIKFLQMLCPNLGTELSDVEQLTEKYSWDRLSRKIYDLKSLLDERNFRHENNYK